MTTNRREFVQLSVLTAGAAGLAAAARTRQADANEAAAPLEILVLGGTGLIGPPMVEYALARGHELTLFNRGKTNTHLFPDVERIKGDRNDDISSTAELLLYFASRAQNVEQVIRPGLEAGATVGSPARDLGSGAAGRWRGGCACRCLPGRSYPGRRRAACDAHRGSRTQCWRR